MEFIELEKRYLNYYAPTFQLLVGGVDLLKNRHMEISSVQVENAIDSPDRFSFVINNDFDITNRQFTNSPDLFELGEKIEIKMGYKNVDQLRVMLVGLISTVQTSFPASGVPQITVSGYDLSYNMKNGKKSRNWENQTDSQVVAEIADKYSLEANVEDSLVQHPRIDQSQESDKKFLKTLAERNGFEIFTSGKTLTFRKPASDKIKSITLEWGKGLISFSPQINVNKQLSKVEVHGWDVQTKKEIVGKATIGDEPGRDGNRESGGEHLLKFDNEENTTFNTRMPVYSQQEADRRAKAILTKRSDKFVTGNGETVGIPDLIAGINLELIGLGNLYSKTYYVEKTTHSIGSSGYKTSFSVKESTI